MAGTESGIDRRGFLRVTAGAGAAMMLPEISFGAGAKNEVERPNILWVSCEDTSPDLGCYGDKYAVTPNIDKLAAQGVRAQLRRQLRILQISDPADFYAYHIFF